VYFWVFVMKKTAQKPSFETSVYKAIMFWKSYESFKCLNEVFNFPIYWRIAMIVKSWCWTLVKNVYLTEWHLDIKISLPLPFEH
jgi:hypothetical protein